MKLAGHACEHPTIAGKPCTVCAVHSEAHMWERSRREWSFLPGIVMIRADFEALKVVSDKPLAMLAPLRTSCRAKINGRWHMVSRQMSCGFSFYPAEPITIRLTATDLAECVA